MKLAPGIPNVLFSLTNRAGGTFDGMIEFRRSIASPNPLERVQALVRLKSDQGEHSSLVRSFELVFVPPGYELGATGSLPSPAYLGVETSLMAAGPFPGRFGWDLPESFGPDRIAVANAQLECLAQSGPMTIYLGEPRIVFSVTNSDKVVYEGRLELFGPAVARPSRPLVSAAPKAPKSPKVDPPSGATNAVKVIELKRVKSDAGGEISAYTETLILPGEMLLPYEQSLNGETYDGFSELTRHRFGKKVTSGVYLIWQLPNSFINQKTRATDQLKQPGNKALELSSGVPHVLFALTNGLGEVFNGLLEFRSPAPAADRDGKVRTTVSLLSDQEKRTNVVRLYQLVAVPPGYELDATGSMPPPASQSVDTAITAFGSSQPGRFTWSLPASFGSNEVAAANAQLERVARRGPLDVDLGEPRTVFSVTNAEHEIYVGRLELFGRPVEKSPQQLAGAVPKTGSPGPVPPTSATNGFKTIELRRVASKMNGGLSSSCDTPMSPGENLIALIRNPDGSTSEQYTTFQRDRNGTTVRSSVYLTWDLPESFKDQKAGAEAQLEHAAESPMKLSAGVPGVLFALTNGTGEILNGMVEFRRQIPELNPVKRVEASVLLVNNKMMRLSGTVSSAFDFPQVPPGYELAATGNRATRYMGAQTSYALTGAFPRQYMWELPDSFRMSQIAEANAQLERLAQDGPITVFLGEPRTVFSVTNSSREVFEGRLELFGPPSRPVSRTTPGAPALAANRNPTTLSGAVPRRSESAGSGKTGAGHTEPGKNLSASPEASIAEKSISLTGLESSTNDLDLECKTSFDPGELLIPFGKTQNGPADEQMSSYVKHRQARGAWSDCRFTWKFPEGFGSNAVLVAAGQIRQNRADRVLAIKSGQPLTLFSVTNQSGGVFTGYLEFKRAVPEVTAKTPGEAMVQFSDISNARSGIMGFPRSFVPLGYALEATDRGSDLRGRNSETYNSRFGSLVPPNGFFTWEPPGSTTAKETDAAVERARELMLRGPITVRVGEPLVVFAITNASGKVYRACLELFGPPEISSK
jgi:hypothetical protein